jgi:hypothetical protein
MTATHDNIVQQMRAHLTSHLSFAVGLLGLMLTLAIGPSMAQDDYLSAARDIPLAPGLEETGDGSLAFDKPEGRIIRVTARDAQDASISKDVLAFYRQTMPNLGWLETAGRDAALTFKRESEMLRISIIGDLVIFDVTPL